MALNTAMKFGEVVECAASMTSALLNPSGALQAALPCKSEACMASSSSQSSTVLTTASMESHLFDNATTEKKESKSFFKHEVRFTCGIIPGRLAGGISFIHGQSVE